MVSERVQRRIDSMLDEAEKALASNDWETARLRATAVRALDPDNDDATAYLAAAERAAGDGSGAIHVRAAAIEGVAPEPALPSSFVAGRYRVLRLLGRGGRKKVYLARDERLGREVAFAVIPAEGLSAGEKERALREAQAMARLGSSPHLVAIHDIGEDDGSLFMVQEFMPGGDVLSLLRKSGEERLPVARTLELAKDICRALEAIHAAGIVHRDLKPANVFLAADGSARVGDLGLAATAGLDRITQHGTMVGTVAYMSPEQALGSEATPASDLYSLGCMLYELVTGKPPFTGEDPTAVITQHINTPPVAPSWLTEHCPPQMEEILLRLLAKVPAERPASAGEALAALQQVDPEQKSVSHSDSNALNRLARGVFVGREKELERLRAAFDEAFAGHGGLVMLVGEPGIGKTRTTQELETYARMRGATVLWGRTHETAGAPPYWPWLQVGAQWVADGGEVESLRLPPDVIGELSRIFPVLRQQSNYIEPPSAKDPESAQFRLFDAYATFLRMVAARAPLLVALDDLHWADQPTLQLLEHIAGEVGRSRILIAGNYRDTDITRQSALSGTLAALNRAPGFERIVLRGLSRDETAEYIRAKANVEPRREVLDRIYEETEGNAFFLSEVVNLMAEEGTLSKDSLSDIAIPDGVKEALGRRLNRLSNEANELLQVAAVIGREFTYDTLTLLGDRDEDMLLRLIEEGIEARVIEEMPQPGRYRFTHAQMQETLLDELSTTRRVRIHGQVGEALERRYGDRAEQSAARLASHFVEAALLSPRFAEKAMRYSALAGRQAMAQSAFPDAVRHLKAALAVRDTDELDAESAAICFDLGRAATAVLDAETTLGCYERAFQFAVAAGDVAMVARVAEAFGHSSSPTDRRREVMSVALEIVEPGSLDEGRVRAAFGFWTLYFGYAEEGEMHLARAREIADSLKSSRIHLLVLQADVMASAHQWHPAHTVEKAEQLIEVARAEGSIEAEFWAQFWCVFYLMIGRLADCRRHGELCRDLAETSKVGYRILTAVYHQAQGGNAAGDWEASRHALERGLEVGPLDDRMITTMTQMYIMLGDRGAVDEMVSRLIRVMRETPASSSLLPCGNLAWIIPMAELLLGRRREQAELDFASESLRSLPVLSPLVSRWLQIGLAVQAILDRNVKAAEEQLQQLEPFAGDLGFSPPCIDHIRALLMETVGRQDDAVETLETALRLQHPDFRPGYAWSAYECARIRFERDGPGDRDRATVLANEAIALAQELTMAPLVEKLIALRVKVQGITTADLDSSIVAVSRAVQSEHPDLSHDAAPDGTVTLMFSDIVDSTPLNERLGDTAWMALLREHSAIVEREVSAHRGHVVKTMGDGFMVAFPSARDGLRCAIALQRAFAGRNDGADQPIDVRIGLHTGEAVRDHGDFFGKHVNLAARIGASAGGGEIVVSSLLAQLVEPSGEFRLEARGARSFKGLEGEHMTYVVRA